MKKYYMKKSYYSKIINLKCIIQDSLPVLHTFREVFMNLEQSTWVQTVLFVRSNLFKF